MDLKEIVRNNLRTILDVRFESDYQAMSSVIGIIPSRLKKILGEDSRVHFDDEYLTRIANKLEVLKHDLLEEAFSDFYRESYNVVQNESLLEELTEIESSTAVNFVHITPYKDRYNSFEGYVQTSENLKLLPWMLEGRDESSLIYFKMPDDSMEPVIFKGSYVIVDTKLKDIRRINSTNPIFLIASDFVTLLREVHSSGLVCKVVGNDKTGNDTFNLSEMEKLDIIGQVVTVIETRKCLINRH